MWLLLVYESNLLSNIHYHGYNPQTRWEAGYTQTFEPIRANIIVAWQCSIVIHECCFQYAIILDWPVFIEPNVFYGLEDTTGYLQLCVKYHLTDDLYLPGEIVPVNVKALNRSSIEGIIYFWAVVNSLLSSHPWDGSKCPGYRGDLNFRGGFVLCSILWDFSGWPK